jgi:hypothetical protein
MRLRLVMLDAYLRAAKRREEVMDVISDAPDRGEARQLVARLLGVTEIGAESVLGMRLHLFSRGEVASIQAEYESLEESLIEDVDMGQCSGMTPDRPAAQAAILPFERSGTRVRDLLVSRLLGCSFVPGVGGGALRAPPA